MPTTTFLTGLSRVLNCPKVHVAITGLVTTWFAIRYVTADLPPTQRASLWVAFIGAVAVQLREIINAWTEEDVAAVGLKKTDAETRGRGDTETDANSASSATADAPSRAESVSASPRPSVSASSSESPRPSETFASGATPQNEAELPSTERSTTMPARTKLPLIMIAFSTIALLTTAGCQTPPELATYREGLHQVDEPLYQAHLLLLNDAVSANLRTDADRQVVQQGINAAEALYQQSKATQAAGVGATTQP